MYLRGQAQRSVPANLGIGNVGTQNFLGNSSAILRAQVSWCWFGNTATLSLDSVHWLLCAGALHILVVAGPQSTIIMILQSQD